MIQADFGFSNMADKKDAKDAKAKSKRAKKAKPEVNPDSIASRTKDLRTRKRPSKFIDANLDSARKKKERQHNLAKEVARKQLLPPKGEEPLQARKQRGEERKEPRRTRTLPKNRSPLGSFIVPKLDQNTKRRTLMQPLVD